jgi:hypothetical protein
VRLWVPGAALPTVLNPRTCSKACLPVLEGAAPTLLSATVDAARRCAGFVTGKLCCIIVHRIPQEPEAQSSNEASSPPTFQSPSCAAKPRLRFVLATLPCSGLESSKGNQSRLPGPSSCQNKRHSVPGRYSSGHNSCRQLRVAKLYYQPVI